VGHRAPHPGVADSGHVGSVPGNINRAARSTP
jgi:hypothetical protein